MGGIISRRDFLKKSITTSTVLAAPYLSGCNKVSVKKRPNILVILTDQQHAKMMSCAGNQYLQTPAMDSLASSGVRFERAYCTDPVCTPSRFSLMTGRMPSEIGLRSNNHSHIESIPDIIKQQGLGHLLKSGGYDTAYGGKVHLPKMKAEEIGFDYICNDERDELAAVCSDYIKKEQKNPFLLVASFINPHDICYMAIRDFAETEHAKGLIRRGTEEVATLDKALQLPEGVSREEFLEKYCPTLPPNFELQKDEPEAINQLVTQRPFRKKARERYTEERWRMHRWAYCRLTEMVDAQIGKVLTALHESGKENETLVIFTSDHGDMDSAHRLEHKTTFYEEASGIPLISKLPGVIPAGIVDNKHLISNGLDLIPTLCDFAGIEIPGDLKGLSFRKIAEAKEQVKWRSSIPVESEIGRMVVTQKYKYMLYDEGKNNEQLIDIQENPFEMRNDAEDIKNKKVLSQHRIIFKETFDKNLAI
ncbi:sulfatase [candidate division KSB1 bacterium]